MIHITVPGTPVPKARPRLGKCGVYTPKKTSDYEGFVAWCARQKMAGVPPFQDAIRVEVEVYFPIPASYSKKKAEQAEQGAIKHTKKPDADNIIKGIFDALNGIVFRDDSQVVHATVSKAYSHHPRAEITVEVVA